MNPDLNIDVDKFLEDLFSFGYDKYIAYDDEGDMSYDEHPDHQNNNTISKPEHAEEKIESKTLSMPVDTEYNNDLNGLHDALYDAGIYSVLRPELNSIYIVVRPRDPHSGLVTKSFVITPAKTPGYFNLNTYKGVLKVFLAVDTNMTEEDLVNKLEEYDGHEQYEVVDLQDIY